MALLLTISLLTACGGNSGSGGSGSKGDASDLTGNLIDAAIDANEAWTQEERDELKDIVGSFLSLLHALRRCDGLTDVDS